MTPPTLHIERAKRVLDIEAQSVSDLSRRIDSHFADAVEIVLASSGRVIVCGIGKSGIIGRKIAATLASTGTPSFFMHPGEAFHGDLGMVTGADVFLALSNSGETDEVLKLLPFLADNGNPIVAMTGDASSTLARAAKVHVSTAVDVEACPLRLAPTSSTTATLAMGDAFAVALMEARDFRPENFARFHPGGSLGRRLLSKVEHVMVREDLPLLSAEATATEVISTITSARLGLVVVQLPEGWALITDGDVRRALEHRQHAFFDLRAADLMTTDPVSVTPGTRTEDALLLMDRLRITALLVIDELGLQGVLTR